MQGGWRARAATARALRLYYAVRDDLRYGLQHADEARGLSCQHDFLAAGHGYCVNSKAGLMAAVCRAVGIPARVGYADVRNHMAIAAIRPDGLRHLLLSRLHRSLAGRTLGEGDTGLQSGAPSASA